jgi:hypothetical protein
MIAVYGRGRWTAFLSPQFPYESHIAQIYYEGEGDLPNPQQMIGWTPDSMIVSMIEYVNARAADDREKSNDEG